MTDPTRFMKAAFEAARQGMADGRGGPFGAVIAKNGEIIATGANQVVRTRDPTAHAEISAIREACRALDTHVLEGCTLYSTCEPCPMCLSAVYWARMDGVVFAATREEAADIGFDDALIYEEIARPIEKRRLSMVRLRSVEGDRLFKAWTKHPSKVPY
jgi:tRNA(Arg) A34 adenosine deaminase TadA